jgi:hypothetical protein
VGDGQRRDAAALARDRARVGRRSRARPHLQGGHFLSDTLFAGVTIWATGWIVREVWLRRVALRRKRLRENGVRSPT